MVMMVIMNNDKGQKIVNNFTCRSFKNAIRNLRPEGLHINWIRHDSQNLQRLVSWIVAFKIALLQDEISCSHLCLRCWTSVETEWGTWGLVCWPRLSKSIQGCALFSLTEMASVYRSRSDRTRREVTLNLCVQGYQDITYALQCNRSMRHIPFPTYDLQPAMKTSPERVDAIIRRMQVVHSPAITVSQWGVKSR